MRFLNSLNRDVLHSQHMIIMYNNMICIRMLFDSWKKMAKLLIYETIPWYCQFLWDVIDALT